MAKDYAKKKKGRSKSGASRSKKKNRAPKGLIFIAIMMIAGLAGLLVYLKWYQPQSAAQSSKKTQPQKQPKKEAKKQISVTDDEVPFYKTHEEMLNKTVEIPLEDLRLPEDDHKYEYLMPCGSFRKQQSAEELKAKIAFAGQESKVNRVEVKSGLWFRVELGPFKSKRKAESIRHRLQDNGFNYCLILPKKIK